METYVVGKLKVVLKRGDITQEEVEAIVNAANTGLRGGGGVDGAIHRAGGPSLLEECRRIGGCATGHAVRTAGGRLPAKHVIHAVGPVWQGGKKGEEDLLRECYINSLKLAEEHHVQSIAFPCISTGIYGFPNALAAEIVVNVIKEFEPMSIKEVRLIMFLPEDYAIYKEILKTSPSHGR